MTTSLKEVDLIKAFIATCLCAIAGYELVRVLLHGVESAMSVAPNSIAQSGIDGPLIMIISYLAFRTFVRIFIIKKMTASLPK
jgi:hypothetical protein